MNANSSKNGLISFLGYYLHSNAGKMLFRQRWVTGFSFVQKLKLNYIKVTIEKQFGYRLQSNSWYFSYQFVIVVR